jgi:hypothetical protein
MAARRVLLGGSISAEPHADPRGAFLYALMRQTHSLSSLSAAQPRRSQASYLRVHLWFPDYFSHVESPNCLVSYIPRTRHWRHTASAHDRAGTPRQDTVARHMKQTQI